MLFRLVEWVSERSYSFCSSGYGTFYEQLLPTRVYAGYKTDSSRQIKTICIMCGKVSKSLAHVLAECSSLALTKYMGKHNAAPKVLLFEMPRDFKLADSVPPW